VFMSVAAIPAVIEDRVVWFRSILFYSLFIAIFCAINQLDIQARESEWILLSLALCFGLVSYFNSVYLRDRCLV
jgi:hypothetical protein